MSLLVPAAEYLRTSTREQPHSMDTQRRAIREYAFRNGFEIVKTYADHGRSGLTLRDRPGLTGMLQDVVWGAAYQAVMVYDVSRWGRFQDGDESAHYEFVCKDLGVKVHYCGESFSNDEGLSTFIFKSLKRTIAAEYSRELSTKCFYGQKRLAEKGFRVGGTCGYGFRRLAISADQTRMQQLDHGQLKSISTDRVVLVPGPPEEVGAIRVVFDLAANRFGGCQAIANELNRRRLPYIDGKPWKAYAVRQILKNKKYCGFNLWNRTTGKLGTRRRRNPPEEWIIVPDAFPALIETTDFEKVQEFLPKKKKWNDSEIVFWTHELAERPEGDLSGPSLTTLRRRMTGVSCLRAHRGTRRTNPEGILQVRQKKDIVRNQVFDALWRLFPDKLSEVHLPRKSRTVLKLATGSMVSLIVCNQEPRRTGIVRWRVRPVRAEAQFTTLICLMHPEQVEYYLVPRIQFRHDCVLAIDHPLFRSGILLPNLSWFYEAATSLSEINRAYAT